MVSLASITTNGKALYLAYDQGFEHGPTDFNEKNVDPNYILDIGVKAGFSAIVFQRGIAEKYYKGSEYEGKLPLILKLNAKTNLVTSIEPYSPQLCSVDEAKALGATAVGYTVYVGSEKEHKMTKELAEIIADAHTLNMPVIGWMYPRGKGAEGKDKAELAAYAARLGLELGADIVKIQHPGTSVALKWAVKAAGKTKVVISGGSKVEEDAFLTMAKEIMQTGCIGLAVGRNVWQHDNPLEFSERLKTIIFS